METLKATFLFDGKNWQVPISGRCKRTGKKLWRMKKVARYLTSELPTRSPDLAPLGFILWSTLKNIVYEIRLTSVDDFQRSIREDIAYLNGANFLSKANKHLEVVYRTCIHKNGGYVENFYNLLVVYIL